jgi:hypothetical protein
MHFNRREFVKYSSICGLCLTINADGSLAFGVDPKAKDRVGIENPLDRLRPFRAPRKSPKEVVPGYLWLEAKNFDDYGGWRLDSFHTDLSAGSSYLIANKIPEGTVEDAQTTIDIAQDGKYYIWVRTRNWLKEYSPGQFKVFINGEDNEHIYGCADSDDWLWESGGSVNLNKGKAKVRIKDLTGHLSRIDSIILTRNQHYQPPQETDSYLKEKYRLTGISNKPENRGKFDVIVVGAGPAGVPAAIAAGRMGCRVALINDRPVLGGNASLELLVPLCGSTEKGTFTRETGILEDLRAERSMAPKAGKMQQFSYISELLIKNEDNVKVFSNENVYKADTNDGIIKKVFSRNTLTDTHSVFEADYFIDCSGDGWLGYYAGAEYKLGKESKKEFNEPDAFEEASNVTMSGSLMTGWEKGLFYYAEEKDDTVEFQPPKWAVKIPNPDKFFDGRRYWADNLYHRGSWWIEYPGETDDLYNEEKARDFLYRITVGFWNLVKNQTEYKKVMAKWKLMEVPHTLAKRETRRLLGDYMLNQNDVEQAKLFDDRVAYAGWSLDVHHPDGVFSSEPYYTNTLVDVNHIPYRCLYSKNISNLFMAGRCGSFSAIALGAVRVECTCGMMGQAAGTAAGMCKQKNVLPRDIYSKHIKQLQQQLLRDDHYIYGIENEDNNDLAKKAKVLATSVKDEQSAPENVINGIARPLNGKDNQWVSAEGLANGQSLKLVFDKPIRMTMIQCVFDTELEVRWPRGLDHIKKLVKSYEVYCFDGEKREKIASVDNNHHRLRRHYFPQKLVKEIEVKIKETYGDPHARIYEIRAYNQG